MTPEPATPIWHVRKEDVRKDSARVANPPFAAFDVVLRRDHEEALAVLEGRLKAVTASEGEFRAAWYERGTLLEEAEGRLAEATEALRDIRVYTRQPWTPREKLKAISETVRRVERVEALRAEPAGDGADRG